MKPTLHLLLLALLLPLSAQDENSDEMNMPEWRREFMQLPQDKREEFAKNLQKARELLNEKRVFECVDILQKANTIFGDNPDVEVLLGACQVEFRNFDKAMEHFRAADQMAPDNANILFNIAEVHFVQKNWEQAEKSLERVLNILDDKEGSGVLQMKRLVQFKLLLVNIKLDRMEKADEMAGIADDIMEDTPYPYFAEAAIAFANGDEVKAELSLARARRVFRNPAIISPWQDSLIEFGYIKSFYGDAEAAASGE